MDTQRPGAGRAWPAHGWAGLLLVAAAWPANWLLPGERTLWLFFPLWLGYTLTIDALVLRRSGSSLIARWPAGFGRLFVASIPAWWLFELLNRRLGNWEYLGGEGLGPLAYFLFASVSFSTVIPAVFESAELLRSFRWTERFASGPRAPRSPSALAGYLAAGAVMLALLLAWPHLFYPFAWLSLIFLLEPICARLRKPALLGHLGAGDWRPAAALAGGALLCGLFWEMWNYWSWPKWTYHTPGAEFAHLFEMPLLGYLGYLPFGLELYPIARLVLGDSLDDLGLRI